VQEALSDSAKELLKQVYNYEPTEKLIEVDPSLYYPTPSLKIISEKKFISANTRV